VGVSISGIQQFVAGMGGDGTGLGLEALRVWCEDGYAHLRTVDDELSARWAVRPSIKLTSVKPSGTVSLLAGATPGLHWPEARTYLRRIRLAANDDLVAPLVRAGYHVEPAVGDETNTVVVEFPIRVASGFACGEVGDSLECGSDVRTLDEVGMWEQLLMASFLQRHWADNQVSCTVTFDPLTEGPQISAALAHFQYMLKGISFLPRVKSGVSADPSDYVEEELQLAGIPSPYPQMPYQRISGRQYRQIRSTLSKPNFGAANQPLHRPERAFAPDSFCDSDRCEPT
jgi:hypothetical protein